MERLLPFRFEPLPFCLHGPQRLEVDGGGAAEREPTVDAQPHAMEADAVGAGPDLADDEVLATQEDDRRRRVHHQVGGLSCVYLFAAFSLKTSPDEGGLGAAQLARVAGWKRALSSVAVEEMLHLAQVANLLTAIGAMPHLRRPNFPQPASAYPLGVPLTLEPVSRPTLGRLVRFELPQALGPGARPDGARPGDVPRGRIEPDVVPFSTVGELYAAIRDTICAIPEAALFIGAPAAQAKGAHVHFRDGLIEVVDRATALEAIEMIVRQGEAASEENPDAHFEQFRRVLREFDEEAAASRASGVPFEPARPVVPDPMTRARHDAPDGALIDDPRTLAVAEIGNLAYDTLLLALMRFFAHVGGSEAEQRRLSSLALALMTRVIGPLGEALARMPFGPSRPGQAAGLGFGFGRQTHFLPHGHAAFIILAERLEHLAAQSARLTDPDLPAEFAAAREALRDLHAGFAASAGS